MLCSVVITAAKLLTADNKLEDSNFPDPAWNYFANCRPVCHFFIFRDLNVKIIRKSWRTVPIDRKSESFWWILIACRTKKASSVVSC